MRFSSTILYLLTIALSYLALLIRFCPKDRRVILVKSITDITVFGPGWIFLKPYRGRVLNIDLRIQQCEVKPFPSQTEKIFFSFKIIDAQKATVTAIQHANYVLEQVDMSDKQKEAMRNSSDFISVNQNTRFFARALVALSYIKFAKEFQVDNAIISKEALEKCKAESDL